MAEADVIVARAFADLATLSITQHRASAEAQRLNEQLSAALTSRVVIEQAKGVICERAGVDLARGLRPAAGLRPQPQPAPHRCRAGRHRRHPRSLGLGPARPSGALRAPGASPVPGLSAVSGHLSARALGPSCHAASNPGVLRRIGGAGRRVTLAGVADADWDAVTPPGVDAVADGRVGTKPGRAGPGERQPQAASSQVLPA